MRAERLTTYCTTSLYQILTVDLREECLLMKQLQMGYPSLRLLTSDLLIVEFLLNGGTRHRITFAILDYLIA